MLALGAAGCNKVVEHRCECRNMDGQLVETDTHFGSADNAQDLCAQRETDLNRDNLGTDMYMCTLD